MDRTAYGIGGDSGLTSSEMTVLGLLGSGLSTARIAATLGVTVCAVESCKRGIYRKLGVVSQAHAVARAIKLGFFDSQRATAGGRRAWPEVVIVHARPGSAGIGCRRRWLVVGRLSRTVKTGPAGVTGFTNEPDPADG
ncbi:helix-turn-helix transcriptional regulator [Acrocarpospora catenulata]|uniref:helix-turn-helix transcriptional regulator n=1 Tax=Acrocarpospora catenulata TaxID=2836182 RepID=UPI0035590F5B